MLGVSGRHLEKTPCTGEAEAGLMALCPVGVSGTLIPPHPQDIRAEPAGNAVPSYQSGLNRVAPWDNCTLRNQSHLCE